MQVPAEEAYLEAVWGLSGVTREERPIKNVHRYREPGQTNEEEGEGIVYYVPDSLVVDEGPQQLAICHTLHCTLFVTPTIFYLRVPKMEKEYALPPVDFGLRVALRGGVSFSIDPEGYFAGLSYVTCSTESRQSFARIQERFAFSKLQLGKMIPCFQRVTWTPSLGLFGVYWRENRDLVNVAGDRFTFWSLGPLCGLRGAYSLTESLSLEVQGEVAPLFGQRHQQEEGLYSLFYQTFVGSSLGFSYTNCSFSLRVGGEVNFFCSPYPSAIRGSYQLFSLFSSAALRF